MTPKIERFMAEQRLETPFLVVDLDVIRRNYQALRAAMPVADIYYAVKANPAAPVMRDAGGDGLLLRCRQHRRGRAVSYRWRRTQPCFLWQYYQAAA